MIKLLRRSTYTRLLQRARQAERRAERAERRALTDSLTGLHNRGAFDVYVDKLIENDVPFSGVIFDMANLKPANTALGHWGADEFIRNVGKVLREEDFSARTGGDEFAVLLPGSSRRQAQVVRDRLEADFGTHKITDDLSCFLIGTTFNWKSGENRQDLIEQLKLADLRLEQRKIQAKIFLGEPIDRFGAMDKVL